MWMGPNWEAPVLSVPATALWQVWTPGDRLRRARYGTLGHHQWGAHLPPLSPELRPTIQICPLLHSPPAPVLRSDPNNCRIYYTKLDENWKAAKHSACSTTCSAPALFMTFHKTHLRPDDQLTFPPPNQWISWELGTGNSQKFSAYCFNWFCKMFWKCPVKCW